MLLAGQRSGRKDQKVKNETIYYFPERFITIESTEKTITLCVTLCASVVDLIVRSVFHSSASALILII